MGMRSPRLNPEVQAALAACDFPGNVRERGSINNSECRDLLQVGIQRACYLLRKIHRTGLLVRGHSRKSAQYRLP